MVDIEELLSEIEMTVKMGKKSLFSDSVTINPDDIYRIVDKIRDNLPDMIREATYVVKNRERQQEEDAQRTQMMMATAERRANEIVREAQAKAEQLVSGHEVTKRAEHEGVSIRNEAHDYSDTVKREANNRAIMILDEAARILTMQVNRLTSAIKDLQTMK